MVRHLAERDRDRIRARMRRAWAQTDYDRALEQPQRLADELDHTHPGAAGSLREGMAETLTVSRLRIKGRLKRTLESTNPCESMIEIVRYTERNVKRWQGGDAPALDRRRHARRRAAIPTDHRLPQPRQARDRDRTPSRHPHRPKDHRAPGEPSARYPVIVTPGSPSSSTTIRTPVWVSREREGCEP
ncbi:MAG: transposase [Solirubrobacterales bacterium]|nr:transposase [Solirubrobacterales bacterium]